MSKIKELIENPHPIYKQYRANWDFLLTSYEGGVDQQEARARAAHLGIDKDLNMPRVGARNCLVKAVKVAKSHNTNYLIEKVLENAQVLQYVVVRKDVVEAGQDVDVANAD